MPQSYSLQQVADFIGASVSGSAEVAISGLASIQDAGPGQLAFLARDKFRDQLLSSQASAIIMTAASAENYTGSALVMDNPYLGYARASALFDDTPAATVGVHATAVVAESATVHSKAVVGPNAVLGERVVVGANTVVGAGCYIGDDTVLGESCYLFANVSIYHNVSLGDRVRIHSGAVIGADGFGFAPGPDGWTKIFQLGGVRIGDDVEIGACTTIDRGALDDTVIENGVIIDNHVMIAHNVRVGENTAMAACSAAAGSTTIGKNCIFAGRSGVVGHVEVGDGVQVNSNTTLTKSVSESGVYASGVPCSQVSEWRKNAARFNQLDSMHRRLSALEKQLKED